jgi:hypothetical protein
MLLCLEVLDLWLLGKTEEKALQHDSEKPSPDPDLRTTRSLQPGSGYFSEPQLLSCETELPTANT